MATVYAMKRLAREQERATDQEATEPPKGRLFARPCALCGATHPWPENPEACAFQAAKTGGEGDGPSF